MNKLGWLFACSNVSGKLQVICMHMVRHGCDLLCPGTLKSVLCQE